ncbi:MAG: hypothetical protein P8R37_00095 [Opitutae bacterium]|nr:hypothetical protein [Opitutae bacterium]MDG1299974.1 hypothetical protein [Opitutae bacterium]
MRPKNGKIAVYAALMVSNYPKDDSAAVPATDSHCLHYRQRMAYHAE